MNTLNFDVTRKGPTGMAQGLSYMQAITGMMQEAERTKILQAEEERRRELMRMLEEEQRQKQAQMEQTNALRQGIFGGLQGMSQPSVNQDLPPEWQLGYQTPGAENPQQVLQAAVQAMQIGDKDSAQELMKLHERLTKAPDAPKYDIKETEGGYEYFPQVPGGDIIPTGKKPPVKTPLVEVNTGNDAGQGLEFKDVMSLRKEFTDVTKVYRDVKSSYEKIETVGRNPSAAGDLALVFGYMKLIDPGSTVREGEQATATNARGVADSVRNIYNRVITGERLTTDQRKDFVNQARNQFKPYEDDYKKNVRGYKKLAQDYKVDPRMVVGEEEETKMIGGKNYRKIGGRWYEE